MSRFCLGLEMSSEIVFVKRVLTLFLKSFFNACYVYGRPKFLMLWGPPPANGCDMDSLNKRITSWKGLATAARELGLTACRVMKTSTVYVSK